MHDLNYQYLSMTWNNDKHTGLRTNKHNILGTTWYSEFVAINKKYPVHATGTTTILPTHNPNPHVSWFSLDVSIVTSGVWPSWTKIMGVQSMEHDVQKNGHKTHSHKNQYIQACGAWRHCLMGCNSILRSYHSINLKNINRACPCGFTYYPHQPRLSIETAMTTWVSLIGKPPYGDHTMHGCPHEVPKEPWPALKITTL